MFFTLPDIFYEINIASISLRLILAIIIGGAVGLERGANKHPAGFRTHILVCVGSAIVMLTNQFCFDHFYTAINNGDVVRLGAQVITGVGFLGAGTIIVAGREKVKGLTTAAGLWASACIGLACGIGFYSGAIIGGILIFCSLTVLPKFEEHVYAKSRAINYYLIVDSVTVMRDVSHYIEAHNGSSIEVTLIKVEDANGRLSFNIIAFMPKGTDLKALKHDIELIDGVFIVENY
ncbi:MAG: MgtC/SapB family protein [Bacillota bacterium]|nr:MgtC/SapB family protein [Bacillota bacterium]